MTKFMVILFLMKFSMSIPIRSGYKRKMYFSVKKITFLGRYTNIILQNKNGPCPLIAIANCLLLQHKIELWKNVIEAGDFDVSVVSLEELTQLVAETILENQKSVTTGEDLVVDSLELLPKLSQGLDLNVIYTDCTTFEFTREISVFDSLNIPLYHGWLPSPEEHEVYAAVKDKSYTHLVLKIVESKALRSNKAAENQELLFQADLYESFLNSTSPQLTFAGLLDIYRHMRDRQLAVIFRNNHFSTLFSIDGQIYSLVTDLGYLEEPSVVWELLEPSSIHGDSDYYDSFFCRLSLSPRALPSAPTDSVSGLAVGAHSQRGGRIASGDTICAPPISHSDPSPEQTGQTGQTPLHDSRRSQSGSGAAVQGGVARPWEDQEDLSGSPREEEQRDFLGLTQEERDFQHAMLLQLEEQRGDEARQRLEQGQRLVAGPPPPSRRSIGSDRRAGPVVAHPQPQPAPARSTCCLS